MNTKEIKRLDGDDIAIMTYQCFLNSKEELDAKEAYCKLTRIILNQECNKVAEEFITAVIERDEKHVFYKYLLDVLSPLYGAEIRSTISDELIEYIKIYLEKGHTDLINAQLSMYYKIVDDENIPNVPCLYHIMAKAMVDQPLPKDNPDLFGLVYKLRKSMIVTNTLPMYPAHICAESYCIGYRHPEVVNTVKQLHEVLVSYSSLCLKRIETKYDETGCLKTSIRYGIKKMLPKPLTLRVLDPDLWEISLAAIIGAVCDRYNTDDFIDSEDSIFSNILKEMNGTSSFNPIKLASVVLGYNNLRAAQVILSAATIMRRENPEEVSPKDMFMMYWYDV